MQRREPNDRNVRGSDTEYSTEPEQTQNFTPPLSQKRRTRITKISTRQLDPRSFRSIVAQIAHEKISEKLGEKKKKQKCMAEKILMNELPTQSTIFEDFASETFLPEDQEEREAFMEELVGIANVCSNSDLSLVHFLQFFCCDRADFLKEDCEFKSSTF